MLSLFHAQSRREADDLSLTDVDSADPPSRSAQLTPRDTVVLSFDVEEHYRIEAATGLAVPDALAEHCRQRADWATRSLLDLLAEHRARATFFVVGQLARDNPALLRAIAHGGHEVASHGWDHTRLHRLGPASFRADLRQSADALRQATGQAVVGYRAPTFSVTRQTAWAVDELAEAGLLYDSSIYPVRHDRYGVPGAPRGPFWARGRRGRVLELPPATLRVCGVTAPMGGGGYFRLFPLFLTRRAVSQSLATGGPRVAMLYFHPWEFDLEQQRLPMGRSNCLRTYVGIGRTTARLRALLQGQWTFQTASEVASRLRESPDTLPHYRVAEKSQGYQPGRTERE